MIPLSHFLLSAGHSMLFLVESIKGEAKKNVIKEKFTFSSIPASSSKHDSVQCHEFRSTCEAFGAFRKEHKDYILRLAICCITYCKYLASICYGPQHHLADHAKYLLEGISILRNIPEQL